jgi:folylpolyglutamate synthase
MHTMAFTAEDADAFSFYESAVAALNSPLHQSVTKDAIQRAAARRTRTLPDMQTYLQRLDNSMGSLPETVTLIHVTGTKGKGSVCAMCEAIVRSASDNVVTGLFTSPHLMNVTERIRINGRPVAPNIFGEAYWQVRTRLETAAKEESTNDDNNDDFGLPVLPGYFRMLTLVALYIFRNYRTESGAAISIVILEVGMGGRYDATNCLETIKPPICGVTLIDYDHVRVLGHTLPEIAWEKGGIFQRAMGNGNGDGDATPHPVREKEAFAAAVANVLQSPAAPTLQSRCFALATNDSSVVPVLQLCARLEGHCELQLVGGGGRDTVPPLGGAMGLVFPPDRALGLAGSHQRDNAALAMALCEAALRQRKCGNDDDDDESMVPETVYQALEHVSWPARCQTVEFAPPSTTTTTDQAANKPMVLRLDGAHTVQSLRAGLEWYQSVANGTDLDPHKNDSICRVLVFNCSHERNPVELLQLLQSTRFHAAYFCVADSERPSALAKSSATDLLVAAGLLESFLAAVPAPQESPTWQDTLLEIWKHLENETNAKTDDMASNLTVQDALDRTLALGEAMSGATRIEMFVTGSLYLVGSMLKAINWSEPEAKGTLVCAP